MAIVALGGVGKSTLINHWLDRLGVESWRGARRVYGHSFYSQGTQHETASTDAFISEALRWFGDEPRDEDRRSSWAKGERLAELVKEQRTLLILDGMEPLQLPPGPNEGRVQDPALQALIRGLSVDNPGLCVITSRMKVTDLARSPKATRQIDLDMLPPVAGMELLQSLGVDGPEKELLQASRDFGNHALALTLLGTYLTKAHGGDVRKCKEIKLTDAADAVVGAHARNMMTWYEKWFRENGRLAEVSILRMLGLFNRPAEKGCIDALREEPAIPELTDGVVGINAPDWNLALSNLRQAGLIAKVDDQNAAWSLDCHPLVREHFGEMLRREHVEACKTGHNRLYEYLKGPGCTKELPDTLEEMQPLFAAVMHGCAAGRHQQAYGDVYRRRINRGNEYFSTRKLGAFGADLGSLFGFFDDPWCRPLPAFSPSMKSFVVSQAGHRLRALGRLTDAVEPQRVGLDMDIEFEDWTNAAISAGNLSELMLVLGDVEKATLFAKQSVEYADDSAKTFQTIGKRTTLAHALNEAGRAAKAEELFKNAERIQVEWQPKYPLLYTTSGFHYCGLMLDQGAYENVIKRATQTLEWISPEDWMLHIGLDHLSLARAYLLQARAEGGGAYKKAWAHLDTAVDKVREAGQQEFISQGLLARAELHIFTRDFDDARADLNEAYDIATRDPLGHMKLFVTDFHLISARLDLAMAGAEEKAATASADSELKIAHEAKSAEHTAAARKHVDDADTLIQETGYHRRDGDLAELKELLP